MMLKHQPSSVVTGDQTGSFNAARFHFSNLAVVVFI